ncbi:L-lysine 6-monooxygenase (NADPH-requiring)-domain-containing protein [Cantharellus anzutake]|uniref:L-lysine 6-monooxygenase (NADPH-requiring)-domain-containing protein n=1 Tax=Cantharellus anzutake TaxID=1750568 RepID=UPI0019051264|nr:L-lysine 6-monooxygenase (NADPH-requiring)-domain-containing protein [Cantharellus anzutake]KAF8332320.1 L-lysine 6-monooxygenase (NADPH-requiring)-domain-containing protein [Cantharellus anzutake]
MAKFTDHSFLKDLAMLRSPTSSDTFLSYLHEHNRLVTFINRGSFIPSRREYSDYLIWAAEKVAREPGVLVHYGERVLSIQSDGLVVSVTSLSESGHPVKRVRRGKHLVIAPGGTPRVPPSLSALAVRAPSRTIHTSVYAHRIDGIMHDILSDIIFKRPSTTTGSGSTNFRPVRIAVVGSGQSAAEVLLDIQARLGVFPPPAPSSEHSVPSNHSVDLIIHRGTKEARSEVKREYENTNYGVVNPNTLAKVSSTGILCAMAAEPYIRPESGRRSTCPGRTFRCIEDPSD